MLVRWPGSDKDVIVDGHHHVLAAGQDGQHFIWAYVGHVDGGEGALADHGEPRDQEEGGVMDFGEALDALRDGFKLARSGWNGKGMYIVLQPGYPDGIGINANTAEATGIPQGTVCVFRPYLMMFTADGEFVPWVASQTDLLASDWETVT